MKTTLLTEDNNCRIRILVGSFVAILITIMIYNLPSSEPKALNPLLPKEQIRQSNGVRLNVISKPELKQGKLFERSINMYDMPKYRYETGYPLTGNDYLIIRL